MRGVGWLLVPWAVGLVGLTVVPLGGAVWLACTSDAGGERAWVGLEQVKQVVGVDRSYACREGDPWWWRVLGGRPRDPVFWHAVVNTVGFAGVAVPVSVVVALVLALGIHSAGRLGGVFRTIFYLPHIIGGVATVLMWQALFDPQVGWINGALRKVYGWVEAAGVEGAGAWPVPGWLYAPDSCRAALVIIFVWGCGGAVLIFLAGLQQVPQVLYEAARLDGAGWWRRLWRITLPQLSPLVLFHCVSGGLAALGLFRDAYVVQHYSQRENLKLVGVYLYERAFEDQMAGYGSAVGLVWFVAMLVVSVIQVAAGRRWVHYGAA